MAEFLASFSTHWLTSIPRLSFPSLTKRAISQALIEDINISFSFCAFKISFLAFAESFRGVFIHQTTECVSRIIISVLPNRQLRRAKQYPHMKLCYHLTPLVSFHPHLHL